MNSWPASIRNHWLVAARSAAVTTKPVPVTILDTHLALARIGAGELVALEDRCPHRQMPLSAGRVTHDGVECPYHGWTFGSGGVCTKIPGLQGARPAALRVSSHAVLERDGLIWVHLGRAAEVPALPELVMRLEPRHRRFLWQTLWNAPVIDCLENFLDAMHTHYVHAGLVRKSSQRRTVEAVLSTDAEGFSVDYRGPQTQSGIIYRLFESNRTSERAVFASPGSAQLEYRYRNGSTARITLHFTPRDAWNTHVFPTFHIEGRRAPAWAVRLFLWPFLHRVSTQDARTLRMQSANRARFGTQKFISTRNDFVRPHLERIWTEESASEARAKVTRVELAI